MSTDLTLKHDGWQVCMCNAQGSEGAALYMMLLLMMW